MGWEYRGRKRYYYRSKRIGRRGIKGYLGRGAAAEKAAAEDALKRAERSAKVARLLPKPNLTRVG